MPILKKPEYDGVIDGQVVTHAVKVPKMKNGRVVRFPWVTPEGVERWMVVKETRLVVQWAWDHDRREWVTEDVWKSRRKGPNAGKVLVSKHDDMYRAMAERQRRANAKLRRAAKKARKK